MTSYFKFLFTPVHARAIMYSVQPPTITRCSCQELADYGSHSNRAQLARPSSRGRLDVPGPRMALCSSHRQPHRISDTVCVARCTFSSGKAVSYDKVLVFLRYVRVDALEVGYERRKALDMERRIAGWLSDNGAVSYGWWTYLVKCIKSEEVEITSNRIIGCSDSPHGRHLYRVCVDREERNKVRSSWHADHGLLT